MGYFFLLSFLLFSRQSSQLRHCLLEGRGTSQTFWLFFRFLLLIIFWF